MFHTNVLVFSIVFGTVCIDSFFLHGKKSNTAGKINNNFKTDLPSFPHELNNRHCQLHVGNQTTLNKPLYITA